MMSIFVAFVVICMLYMIGNVTWQAVKLVPKLAHRENRGIAIYLLSMVVAVIAAIVYSSLHA